MSSRYDTLLIRDFRSFVLLFTHLEYAFFSTKCSVGIITGKHNCAIKMTNFSIAAYYNLEERIVTHKHIKLKNVILIV